MSNTDFLWTGQKSVYRPDTPDRTYRFLAGYSSGDWDIRTQAPSERCSPAATQSLKSEKQLPPEPKPFGGVIKRDARESKPCWDPRIVPPKGAPNVLLIMTDDAGFGVSSTFGGVIPTPALDRIAKNGLRYTNFNSTALCSPTRAALITGATITPWALELFGNRPPAIPVTTASSLKILKENGYATSWFGKDHNTPAFSASQAGPFDQWPVGMGYWSDAFC